MAYEVIDGLGNMKLTFDEEEVIPIFDRRLEALESCNLSLIWKFLTCKPFNKRAAKNTLKRAWGLEDVCKLLRWVHSQLEFESKFQSEFDMSRILQGGP